MDIPRDALDIRHNSSGFLPSLGLHRRGTIYRQESSYSHIGLLLVMLVLAVIVFLQPWWGDSKILFGKLSMKHLLTFGCAWGGICGMAPYFLRNKLGQLVVIEPDNRMLRLVLREPNIKHGKLLPLLHREHEELIPWRQIIMLQICHQTDPEWRGYQLNLVWQDHNREIRRHCLAKHSSKRIVMSLGRRYERLFGFKLADHTKA